MICQPNNWNMLQMLEKLSTRAIYYRPRSDRYFEHCNHIKANESRMSSSRLHDIFRNSCLTATLDHVELASDGIITDLAYCPPRWPHTLVCACVSCNFKPHSDWIDWKYSNRILYFRDVVTRYMSFIMCESLLRCPSHWRNFGWISNLLFLSNQHYVGRPLLRCCNTAGIRASKWYMHSNKPNITGSCTF